MMTPRSPSWRSRGTSPSRKSLGMSAATSRPSSNRPGPRIERKNADERARFSIGPPPRYRRSAALRQVQRDQEELEQVVDQRQLAVQAMIRIEDVQRRRVLARELH